MNILIIGLGSMGKRRVRNLKHLGIASIAGFDIRQDRLNEAREKYKIPTYDSLEAAFNCFKPNALVISVPPDLHTKYINMALDKHLDCFVEASVTHADQIYKLSKIADEKNILVCPSCTMKYYPGPAKIKQLINSNELGKPLNFTYYSGQYLPDWHPWENIEDFYVSNRETGGCKEIVPFELTWLNDIFGHPKLLSSIKTKISTINADIDDIYQINLVYPGRVLCSLIVDVIARPTARREMYINCEKGQAVFSVHENIVRHIKSGDSEWTIEHLDRGTIENSYINPEEPYILEMNDFIEACTTSDHRKFPNTLLNDWSILSILESIEDFSTEF